MRLALACAASVAVLLVAAPAASAAPACVLNGTTAEVTGEPEFVVVALEGVEIKALTSSGTFDCGAATTSNTDSVVVTAPPDVDVSATAASVPLPGGATDEPGDTDEIEVTAVGYRTAYALGAFGAPNTMSGGRLDDERLAANLNAAAGDADADLIVEGAAFLGLLGGNEADVLSADGSAGTGAPWSTVDVYGEAGNDTLTAGGFLIGGGGDDSLTAVTGAGADPVVFYEGTGDVEVVLPGGTPPGKDGTGGTDTYVGVTQVFTSGGDDKLTAGADAALLGGASGDDELAGGPGADALFDGTGDDTVTGGGGDDALAQHQSVANGADVLRGGDGFDRVYYGASGVLQTGEAAFNGRTEPVFVTIGDGPNDGEADENDDVQADVEYVRGGSGADTLIGSEAGERLAGLTGADTVDGRGGVDLVQGDGADAEGLVDAGNVVIGGAGRDRLEGSEGPDDLRADDGDLDEVTCGAGIDFGPFDAIDVLTEDC
ncbi:MAG TPA: hypothetical protein VGW10_10125, partial [Solirubrobacteraceae bacterium]|nr:hypothetical protein [Solirubrobacteraceae bacterium]